MLLSTIHMWSNTIVQNAQMIVPTTTCLFSQVSLSLFHTTDWSIKFSQKQINHLILILQVWEITNPAGDGNTELALGTDARLTTARVFWHFTVLSLSLHFLNKIFLPFLRWFCVCVCVRACAYTKAKPFFFLFWIGLTTHTTILIW